MHDNDKAREWCTASIQPQVNEIFEAAQKGTPPRAPVIGDLDSWDERHSDRLMHLACIAFTAQVVAKDKAFFVRYCQSWIDSGAPMDEIRKVFGRFIPRARRSPSGTPPSPE
jgi:hypothetical protein